MHLPPGYAISAMRDHEIPILEGWAASEGWNPGLADLTIARAVDPDCFVALRHDGELAGGGSIFCYDGRFGFMGLFIMRADLRRQGFGARLWHWRRDTLLSRLETGASIGMDGVYEMVPFYERGGFKAAYRHLRYQGTAIAPRGGSAEVLGAADFTDIEAFDRAHVATPRPAFLRRWLEQPGAYVAGVRDNGKIAAYGVARPCRTGYKIGPLFTARPDAAEAVFSTLLRSISGHQVQIDVPEPNTAALNMVAKADLSLSFGCVRLYYGTAPSLPVGEIYGVTSLEFG